ncbi:7065_t:CDS:2 [Paraglomus occultum]|uniref:7065_t:CDS:1 n=1 Tax=Paraglomus occultum TaxID=144539 RepID=A0A9N9BW88_9GLOM|nr:7065_t:CDS:2 [Paraglomus occultum]
MITIKALLVLACIISFAQASSPAFPSCVGHRGLPKQNPENTIRSLQHAILVGADGLESDVRITHDGEVIMMHDTTLDRTTNGTGLVTERNWSGYVEYLKTGGESVPKLTEVLELLMREENRDIWIILDVKDDNPIEILDALASVFNLYPNYDFTAQFHIGIWNEEFFMRTRKVLPGFPTSFIGSDISLARVLFDKVESFNMEFIFVFSDQTGFFDEVKSHGRSVFVWTVNKEKDMHEAIKFGVDAILSDYVDRCLRVRRRKGGKGLALEEWDENNVGVEWD